MDRPALAARLGVDPRALAALRVGLGATLLLDVLLRARWLRAFYTDAGVLPRAALRARYPLVSQLSLHALSGAAWVQAALFVAAGVAALALLLGYRTRAAALVSFLLLVSLHARNPLVLNAGDSLLRRTLLWSLFLPLGARWAVDAGRRATLDSDRVVSVASTVLLAQVVVVYAVNAALKLRSDEWLSGTAVRLVFSLDQFTVLLGDALAGQALLLTAANWAWLALLCAAPLLLVSTGRARTALAALFVAAHVGMALTMRLGVFPLVTAVALLPFFPPAVWDAVAERSAPLRRTLPTAARLRPRPLLPTAVGARGRRAASALVAVLFAATLVWNAAALGGVSVDTDAAALDPGANTWDMFAPEPLRTDGWYVMAGRLASGATVDAFRGGPVSFDRPPDVAATYPSARWRKYLVDEWRAGGEGTASLAGYLCGRWNRTHGSALVAVRIVYVEQPTRLDGPEPTRRVTLGRHRCGAVP
jgi:hypothetical protein